MSIIAPIQGFPSGGGGGSSVPIYFVTKDTNLSTILQNLSGVNTIELIGGVTLTVDQNITLPSNISLIAGNGVLFIPDGMTLTLNSNLNLAVDYLDGGKNYLYGGETNPEEIEKPVGTLLINSGCTLTITSQINLGRTSSSGIFIKGSGTLQIAPIGNLILYSDAYIVFGVSTVNIYGTISVSGNPVSIFVAQGVTQIWYVYGSVTGQVTLDIFGTVYWFGNGIVGSQNIDAMPGSTWGIIAEDEGMFIGSPYIPDVFINQRYHSLATNPITLSNTTIAPGSSDGSNAGSLAYCYFTLTSIQGSVNYGQYGLGFYQPTGSNRYMIFVYIVLGLASNVYSVDPSFKFIALKDDYSDTVYVFNSSASRGSLTISGTAYV
jgi:hypothetical protein